MGVVRVSGILESLGDGLDFVAPLAPVDAGLSKGPLCFARGLGGDAKNEALFRVVPDAVGHSLSTSNPSSACSSCIRMAYARFSSAV